MTKRAAGAMTMAAVTHMSIVAWLRIRVLRIESGAGSVAHRICHVVVAIACGRTVDVRGRARAVVLLVRAVFVTRVKTWVASTSIGLGLALLARVVRTAAVDVLGKEGSKIVLEALCFLQVKLFLCLLY
jgi:hypothetical protein